CRGPSLGALPRGPLVPLRNRDRPPHGALPVPCAASAVTTSVEESWVVTALAGNYLPTPTRRMWDVGMNGDDTTAALRRLARRMATETIGDRSDRQLVEQFLTERDE